MGENSQVSTAIISIPRGFRSFDFASILDAAWDWGVLQGRLFRVIACALAAAIAYLTTKFLWKLLWLRFLAKGQAKFDELRCREEQVLKKTQALNEAEEQWAEKVLAAQAELEKVREAEISSRQRQAKAEASAQAALEDGIAARAELATLVIQIQVPGVNYLDRLASIILTGGSEACWV